MWKGPVFRLSDGAGWDGLRFRARALYQNPETLAFFHARYSLNLG